MPARNLIRRIPWDLVICAVLAAIAVSALIVDSGYAASSFGDNFANELKAIAGPILLVLAAMIMIPMLGQRKPSQLLVVALMTIVIGAFLFTPGAVKSQIADFATSVLGK
jgi:hypothetical protein